MRFTNFDRSYQVMRHLGGTNKTEEFLCTEQTGEEVSRLLIRITDAVLAKRLTIFLEEKIKGREFTDYLECFRENENFLIVLCYSKDQSLTEHLQREYCGRRERAEIARGIFERLLMQNPHLYFAWNGLETDQITVSRSLEIHWNYHLKQVEQFEEFTVQDVGLQLRKIFLLLFSDEAKKQIYPRLNEYLQGLESGMWNSYIQMFQEFLPVYEDFLKEDQKEPLPKTFLFRFWERMKKLMKIGQKILAVVIVVAAVVYVITKLQDHSSSQTMIQTMSQIGDLIVEEPEAVVQENGEE